MALEDFFGSSTDLLIEVGKIGNWLQALGLLIIIWIIIQVTNWLINRKRIKILHELRQDINKLDERINKLSRQLKKT